MRDSLLIKKIQIKLSYFWGSQQAKTQTCVQLKVMLKITKR